MASKSNKRVEIQLPSGLYKQANALVKRGLFSSMSSLIRAGIRDQLLDTKDLFRDLPQELSEDEKRLLDRYRQRKRKRK